MIKYDFVFNHKKASELNIRVTERPSIPAAQKNIEEINMENMDGSYYMEDGTYNDIQITLSCNFRSPEYAWNENVRAIKEWLHGFDYAGNHLVMNDDPDYFFKVKKVETSDFDRVYKQIGKFTVTFTCEGFQYYTRGTVPILCDGTLYNDGAMCKPTYILTDTTGEGKGVVRLFVNGNIFIVDFQSVTMTINTERMLTYGLKKRLLNSDVQGNYESLYLYPGINEVEVKQYVTNQQSRTVQLEVIPNWRRL